MAYSLLNNTFKLFLFFCCFYLPNIGFSAVVDGLFNSSVEVETQQASDREQAFNQALIQILLKVSGHRDLVLDTKIQAAFFPAERYVQSFSYKENPRYSAYLKYQKQLDSNLQAPVSKLQNSEGLSANDAGFNGTYSNDAGSNDLDSDDVSLNGEARVNNPDSDLTENLPDDSALDPSLEFDPLPLPYLLEVTFSSKALEVQMKNVNVPVWGNVRPSIMLWVSVESEGERTLIGQSNPKGMIENILKASRTYALPVTFPEADETDYLVLNMSDLWGLFPDALDKVKQRYTSNAHLMVRLYQSLSSSWSANWHFSMNGQTYTGLLHDSSMSAINDEVMSFIAVILAKRFSMASTESNLKQEMQFEVSNIINFKDYIDIQTFLSDLALIQSFSLSWVEGNVMSFLLQLNSSQEQFKEYLELSGKLQYISSSINETLSMPIVIDNNPVVDANTVSHSGDVSNSTDVNSTDVNSTVDIDNQVVNHDKESVLNNESTLHNESAFNNLEVPISQHFIQLDKYKWLRSTPESNHK